MVTKVVDERIRRLLPERPHVERVATGFVFTEGPIWFQHGEYLLFSDVVDNARYRWDARSGASLLARPTGHGNGMTLDASGRLLVCEHDTSSVVRMSADGTGDGRVVVASHYAGRELNSPNDVVVARDGSVFFTDPPWGRTSPRAGLPRDRELEFQGVFRVTPGGAVSVIADDFELPNGLCFSPDEAVLYVNDTGRAHIRCFGVKADGTLAAGRVFAEGIGGEHGGVDGMKCDRHGNVWVTGPGGIWVFDAAGVHLGILELPERVGNLHWGGPDWTWLFAAASSSVYRVETLVSGRLEPFMVA